MIVTLSPALRLAKMLHHTVNFFAIDPGVGKFLVVVVDDNVAARVATVRTTRIRHGGSEDATHGLILRERPGVSSRVYRQRM